MKIKSGEEERVKVESKEKKDIEPSQSEISQLQYKRQIKRCVA